MKRHRPHGSAVTALEADILKLRALEMVLVLFYVEDLKNFIVGTVNATIKLREITNSQKYTGGGEKNIGFKEARSFLISEGVITQGESLELKRMIDYRNIIGHEMHRLTIDIGELEYISELDLPNENNILKYHHSAIKEIKDLTQKIYKNMRGRSFAFEMSINKLAFSSAEKTYLKEINRLNLKIKSKINKFNLSIESINDMITNIPAEVLSYVNPGHPKNTKNNGTFSSEGIKGMFMLYDAKASPLAVSYIMRISYRTALRWYKRWVEYHNMNK